MAAVAKQNAEKDCSSMISVRTALIVNVGKFLVTRMFPTSFVDRGPKLRVLSHPPTHKIGEKIQKRHLGAMAGFCRSGFCLCSLNLAMWKPVVLTISQMRNRTIMNLR